MTAVLRELLKRIVQHGVLEVEMVQGVQFSLGDAKGQPLAIRFVDRAAPRQFILYPALAFGELLMVCRRLDSEIWRRTK